jgi:hypothetical protein
LPDRLPFVQQQLCPVVHAAREAGESTATRAFAKELGAPGTVAQRVPLAATNGIDDTASAVMFWLLAIHERAASQCPRQ